MPKDSRSVTIQHHKAATNRAQIEKLLPQEVNRYEHSVEYTPPSPEEQLSAQAIHVYLLPGQIPNKPRRELNNAGLASLYALDLMCAVKIFEISINQSAND